MESNSRVVPVFDMNPPVADSDEEMDKDDGPEPREEVLDGERNIDASGPVENSALDPHTHEGLVDGAGNLFSQTADDLVLPDFTDLSVSALLGIPASSFNSTSFSPLSAGSMPTQPTRIPFEHTSDPTNSLPPNNPTRRTQWMPDFTFGPASELIDIRAFLSTVQESLEPDPETSTSWDIRPEDVAGWEELRALDESTRQALVEECRYVLISVFN